MATGFPARQSSRSTLPLRRGLRGGLGLGGSRAPRGAGGMAIGLVKKALAPAASSGSRSRVASALRMRTGMVRVESSAWSCWRTSSPPRSVETNVEQGSGVGAVLVGQLESEGRPSMAGDQTHVGALLENPLDQRYVCERVFDVEEDAIGGVLADAEEVVAPRVGAADRCWFSHARFDPKPPPLPGVVVDADPCRPLPR